MATWYDFYGQDYVSFRFFGNIHDTAYGYYGSDIIFGGAGDDNLYGGNGNDRLFGDNGSDNLYGGKHDDILFGGKGADAIWGGEGVDQMHGGEGDPGEKFYFGLKDTGKYAHNEADKIWFFHSSQQIWLEGSYDYAGEDPTPRDGKYSIRQKGDDWLVTYNSPGDGGYHDIIVNGENPKGDVSFF